MGKKQKIKDIFTETGVLQKGHFKLSSGRHADKYLQCAKVLQYPENARIIGNEIAKFWKDKEIDVVIGPALGGIIISYAVGQALGKRTIFSERKGGKMKLRRGFELKPSTNVLIVEDVVTTGGSVQEVINLLETLETNIIGISSLVDRSSGQVKFRYPFESLLQIDVASYSPEDCLLCKNNVPLIRPGSKKKDK
jgi:orotate phosphoribosyltransferase